MAIAAVKPNEKHSHLAGFPYLFSFRGKISDSQYEYWISKSTDGKGGNTDLDVLLGEYGRLGIDPMSCLLVSNMRKNGDKQKQTITVTLKAQLILCERDPNWGGVREGEIVMSEDEKKVISATAYAFRKGSEKESSATIYYVEAVQKNYKGEVSGVWPTRPRGMTMKCAKSAALNLAFPTACAGMATESDFDPTYDEHNLPNAAPAKMVVDTETGEVFTAETPRNITPSQTALPPAPPQTGTHAVAAAARILTPVPDAKPPAATEAPKTENAKVAGGQAFDQLMRHPEHIEQVSQIYAKMGKVARECDEPQHSLVMRVVCGVIKRQDIPKRWVDFTVDELKGYILAQSQPIEESKPPKALKPANPDALIDVPRCNAITRFVKSREITMVQLCQLVKRLTNNRTESHTDLTNGEADKLIEKVRGHLETERAKAVEGAPRS